MGNSSYSLFLNEANEALLHYPFLSLVEKGIPELSGTIILKDSLGLELDSYQIRIVASENYPDLFPFVFETGGKIPKNVDWHVFETDGHLCLCTLTDEYLKIADGISILKFIKEELEPYLFNQTHRRLTGFFLNEMEHGEKGQLMTLKTLLKTDDIMNVAWLLQKAIEGFKMERTELCFCKSGLKYRHCHRDIFERFKCIGEQKLFRLLKFVQSTKEYLFA